MALLKHIVSDEGIVTNYHRVDDVVFRDNILRCTIASYVSKDYRDNKLPADYLSFRFDITLEEEESMGIRALCYSKIKELPEWADAEDC